MINVRLTDALKIVSVCPWQYLQKSTTIQGMPCIIIWADYLYNILFQWKSPSFMHYERWMKIVCQITGFFYLIYKTVCTEQGCRKGNQLKCKCIFRFFSILCSNDWVLWPWVNSNRWFCWHCFNCLFPILGDNRR